MSIAHGVYCLSALLASGQGFAVSFRLANAVGPETERSEHWGTDIVSVKAHRPRRR